jgi:hypothetical protein
VRLWFPFLALVSQLEPRNEHMGIRYSRSQLQRDHLFPCAPLRTKQVLTPPCTREIDPCRKGSYQATTINKNYLQRDSRHEFIDS